MTTPEGNIPQAPDTKTYLAADNEGNIVIVTEGTDGSVSTTDPSESFDLSRAQNVFLEQQRLSTLEDGEQAPADPEVDPNDAVNLDEIQRQAEIARKQDQSDE